MHPLDRWFNALERRLIRDHVCLRAPTDPWTDIIPASDLSPSDVVLSRCILGLEVEEVATEVVPYLPFETFDRSAWDPAFDEELATWSAQADAWERPLNELLAGSTVGRCNSEQLWGLRFGIGFGPMESTAGYYASRFSSTWALVLHVGFFDDCDPLPIPLGLVPSVHVKRLAPLLIHVVHKERGVDWSFESSDEIPFHWMSGDLSDLYRFCLVGNGISDAVYDLSDEELLQAYPEHPSGTWGPKDVAELLAHY